MFKQDRQQLESQRDDLDHRETVKTSVRMVASVVRERAERLDRRAEHARSDDTLAAYFDDVLVMHDGQRDLGFVAQGLADLRNRMSNDHPQRVNALTPSRSGVNAVPDALDAYVAGGSNTTRADVRSAFTAVLASDEHTRVAALAWFLEEGLHPIVDDGVEEARKALRATRERHVNRLRRADEPGDPTNPLQELDWDQPVAMLPVRVETKFDDATPSGGRLDVRVYPDQIHVDSHEDALTEAEYEWGTEFWARLWYVTHEFRDDPADVEAAAVHDGDASADGAGANRLPNDRLRRVVEDLHEQLAADAFSGRAAERFEEVRDRTWGRGVEQFGTERAAYVVHALSPVEPAGGTPQSSRQPVLGSPAGSASQAASKQYGDELLEGPTAGHWVDPVDEFRELQEYEQVWAFVLLDEADQTWVREQLLSEAVRDDLDTGWERLSVMLEALVDATERRRYSLLRQLDDDGRLDSQETEWVRDRLKGSESIRSPPALRFPDVDFRPASWTVEPRARLLPDRWIVYAYWDHPDGRPDLASGQYDAWSTDWKKIPQGGTNDATVWRRWDEDRGQWALKVTGPVIREPLAVGPSPESVAGKDEDEGMSWMIDFAAAKEAGMGFAFENPDDGTWTADVGYDELVVTGVRTSGEPDRTAEAFEQLLAAQEYTQGLSFLEQGTPTNNADEPSGQSSTADPASSAPTKIGAPLLPVDNPERERFHALSEAGVDADGHRVATALGIEPSRFEHVEGADTLRHVDAGHVNESLWPATWGYCAKHFLVPSSWDSVLGGLSTYGAHDGTPEWAGLESDPATLISAWLAKFRNHFREHVRACGPLHTLQVGTQPYGILPATPFDVEVPAQSTATDAHPVAADYDGDTGLWQLAPEQLPEGAFLTTLVDWLSTLRETWLRSADSLPRVGDGPLSDQQLVDLLSKTGTPETLRRQQWLLDDVNAVWQLFNQEGVYDGQVGGSSHRPAGDGAEAVQQMNLAHAPFRAPPRVSSMRFFGQAGVLADHEVFVDDSLPTYARVLKGSIDGSLFSTLSKKGPPSDWEWLTRLRALGGYWRSWHLSHYHTVDYVSPTLFPQDTAIRTPQWGTVGQWDALMQPDALEAAKPWLSAPTDLTTTPSVLRAVLHFATLREVASARIRLGALYDDHVDMAPDPAAYLDNDTIYQKILTDLGAGDTGTLASHGTLSNLADPSFADAIRAAAGGTDPELDRFVERFTDSLDHLSGMDPESVSDHARGTLGLASHRLDAWWTSVASRQLWTLRGERDIRPPDGPRDGLLVGAFGYVEDLAPEPREQGEYLLAPSQNQVTTAAVLRNAHRATDEPAHKDALAVDLSAERVRRARQLLDGVRDGRSLSVQLGYRFERRLHESDEGPDLQQHISLFRSVAPLKADRADRNGNSEKITTSKASDVVDGKKLHQAWKSDTIWSLGPLATYEGTDLQTAVDDILADFDDALDAVNDVLTAEAVHQLSKGNPERATAALEGLSRGKQLPELEVLRTPRRESGVNNRLLVLFGDANWRDGNSTGNWDSRYALRNWEMDDADLIDPADFQNASGQSADTVGMRHIGEPNLNGWVGELLPQPDRIRCDAEFQWTADRSFATGTFLTPTESGTVTVTDVGFEPDVVVFRATNAVERPDGGINEMATAHGWTHGIYHNGDERSLSLATAADANAAEYVAVDDRALAVAVPGDDAATAGIAGSVTATIEDGFRMVFDDVADAPVGVQYQAIATGDETGIQVGHFTTTDAAAAPETQTVNLNDGTTIPPGDRAESGSPPDDPAFDPDHLLVTASNAIESTGNGSVGDRTARGSLVGFSHGEVLRDDDGLTQQAVVSALDPTGGSGGDGHAVGFRDDAAVELLYGDGSGVSEATTGEVTKLGVDADGRPRVELQYDAGGSGGFAGHPQLVTYVAYESPTTEEPVPATHRPTMGYVAAPAHAGEEITFDPGFEPTCVELTVCSSVTAPPGTTDDDGLSVRAMTTDTAGWSHGVATGITDQRVLGQGVRPVGEAGSYVDATAGLGSKSEVLSIPYLNDEGTVTGRDVGRITRMDEGGVTIEFPDLHAAGGSERPVVLYRAWPTVPKERSYAAETSVSLDALNLSPLDAVSLSQVDAEPGLSQLERRLRFYLFRNRPSFSPPVPDDADVELTFAETGTDDEAHVSFAQYLEQARSIRDLLAEARPADADDLAHPSESSGPGYLPAESADESAAADELRKRADEIRRRLDNAGAIIDNRLDLLDTKGDNILDRVDAIDRAVETFCREAPADALHSVADTLVDEHNPAEDKTLVSELQALRDALAAGPTDAATLVGEVVVETGTPDADSQSITGDIGVPLRKQVDIGVRPLSPGDVFEPQSWLETTDGDGEFDVEFDAREIDPGTRFTLVARWAGSPPTLSDVLEEALRELDREERTVLIYELLDDDRIDTTEAYRISRLMRQAGVHRFYELPVDEQIRSFLLMDREDHVIALELMDHENLADFFADGTVGDRPPVVRTGRVVAADDAQLPSPSSVLSSATILPLVVWLDRVVEDIQPTGGSPGRTLSVALDANTIDWGQVGIEKGLIQTIKQLTPPEVFDDDDFDAIRRLTRLQNVDLSTGTGLARFIGEVIEPLEWLGLTSLLELTGPRDRSGEQRVWVREKCDIGDPWGRPCEGSVKARVRNFLRAPGWPDRPPEELQRFAPEFRLLVHDFDFEKEYLLLVEQLLQHPVAVIGPLSEQVDEPEALLQDLNELLYHPVTLAERVDTGDLELRLRQFADWLDRGSRPADVDIDNGDAAAFENYLRARGISATLQVLQQVTEMEPETNGPSLRDDFEQSYETRLTDLRGSQSSPSVGTTQHTIANRVTPAFEKADIGPVFRRGVLETLRRGLLRASYAGIYGATPNSAAGGAPGDEETLLKQASVVSDAITDRADRESAAATARAADAVATQRDRLETLLGEEFTTLPPFAPTNPAELHETFGASDTLLDGNRYAVDTWLQRVSRVRDRPADLRQLLTYADLMDLAGDDAKTVIGDIRESVVRRSLTVGQIPHGAGGDQAGSGPSWLGLDDVTPEGGELSMAAHFVTKAGSSSPVGEIAASPPMAGLFVDGWVEKVPDAERRIGVGFQYDDPDVRPPQSIVLAVPPSWSRNTEEDDDNRLHPTAPLPWSMETLVDTVEETTDLAKMRSVDLDTLDSLGHVLPATAFAFNEDSAPLPTGNELFLPDAPSVLLDFFEWEELE
jgi:hypothetical protein